jgi:hypothetical protein
MHPYCCWSSWSTALAPHPALPRPRDEGDFPASATFIFQIYSGSIPDWTSIYGTIVPVEFAARELMVDSAPLVVATFLECFVIIPSCFWTQELRTSNVASVYTKYLSLAITYCNTPEGISAAVVSSFSSKGEKRKASGGSHFALRFLLLANGGLTYGLIFRSR